MHWPTDRQMAQLAPDFPKSPEKPQFDAHRAVSGIILVARTDRRWRDAPREYGPRTLL